MLSTALKESNASMLIAKSVDDDVCLGSQSIRADTRFLHALISLFIRICPAELLFFLKSYVCQGQRFEKSCILPK